MLRQSFHNRRHQSYRLFLVMSLLLIFFAILFAFKANVWISLNWIFVST
ncbi:DUF6095 family protein [Globicatella sp. PHS-GS-PNBC-21-1553]|nr:DUF6095 family protein [Globicatella sp. PHS-GS-PNBC-21-1553]